MTKILNNALADENALYKNYIINGSMQVSQENGTTAGNLAGANYYAVDMFLGTASTAGQVTAAQVSSTTPDGSPNRLRLTVTTADASVAAGDCALLLTNIEGIKSSDLKFGTASAKTITLRFGVKAPAGTYCIGIRNGTPNRAYVAEYTISAGEANTDVIKTVTIPGDTSGTWSNGTGIGITIIWCVMGGSTFQTTPNVWSASTNVFATSNQFNLLGTNGNVFELFDVALYEGTVTPATYKVPDLDTTLLMCKRYFESILYTTLGFFATASGQVLYCSLPFTDKRASPTVSFKSAPPVSSCTVALPLVSTKDVRLDITSTAGAQCFTTAGNILVNARL